MFPFTSYIHLDDLMQHFKHKKLWKELHNSKVDFSKPPVAYYWEAYYLNESDDENAQIDESLYFGNSLPEDAEDIRWSFEEMPTVVHIYPLYELPKELVEPANNSQFH